MRKHREALVRSCGDWSEDRYQCVMTAASAAALKHCGLEDYVRGYTDEVLTDYAARPFHRPGAPGRERRARFIARSPRTNTRKPIARNTTAGRASSSDSAATSPR